MGAATWIAAALVSWLTISLPVIDARIGMSSSFSSFSLFSISISVFFLHFPFSIFFPIFSSLSFVFFVLSFFFCFLKIYTRFLKSSRERGGNAVIALDRFLIRTILFTFYRLY